MRPSLASLCLCLTLCAALFAAPQARAQGDPAATRSEIITLLGRIYEGEAMRGELEGLGFRGQNLSLAMGQVQRIMRDPVVAGHIADRVLAVQSGASIPMSQSQGLLWGLVDQGVGHLPLRDLRYYYLVEKTVLNAMPTRQCGLAVRERLSPDQLSDATAQVAARLNTNALENYYRIQLEAAKAGAQRGPVTMTTARAQAAEERIFSALTTRLDRDPDAPRLIAAFADLDRASNRDACAAGRVFIDTVLTLEGQELRDALIYLSQPTLR
ncbi:hypothetical protein KUD11_02305 [Roseovarius sp. LXJ103]|uniref:hypothetical protein n=1 Tax=Roseovarius carneus TaxID=2853164 RepID=UPI000D60CBC9|nr:hypothetical protein [Roseovarius carneus]MBZ8117472.1 hypothetical protein [Roseovarius carneus]PWE36728.1 hypothetical protein DD563_12640 [Pelagicola sp. LXJ1103]